MPHGHDQFINMLKKDIKTLDISIKKSDCVFFSFLFFFRYVPLQSCIHRVPVQENERGSQWPEEWPERLQRPPYWLNASNQMGIYGKPASVDFTSDYQDWQKIVSKSYMNDLGISWSNVRNVMDMRAVYGG